MQFSRLSQLDSCGGSGAQALRGLLVPTRPLPPPPTFLVTHLPSGSPLYPMKAPAWGCSCVPQCLPHGAPPPPGRHEATRPGGAGRDAAAFFAPAPLLAPAPQEARAAPRWRHPRQREGGAGGCRNVEDGRDGEGRRGRAAVGERGTRRCSAPLFVTVGGGLPPFTPPRPPPTLAAAKRPRRTGGGCRTPPLPVGESPALIILCWGDCCQWGRREGEGGWKGRCGAPARGCARRGAAVGGTPARQGDRGGGGAPFRALK